MVAASNTSISACRIAGRLPASTAGLYYPDVRIAYVLPAPELNGGNKVIFQHAGFLLAAGHEVTVLAAGPRPDWAAFHGAYRDYSAVPAELPAQDLVIATFWT